MEVRLSEDNKKWDAWLVRQDQPPFTQSSEWAEILKQEGKQAERLEFYDESGKVAEALVVYAELLFGWSYAFCPKGPVMLESADERVVYLALKDYCLKKPCVFVRVEPSNMQAQKKDFEKVIDINPRATTYIDLRKEKEELLDAMHPKTRYNIRLAEKKDLEVSADKDVNILYELLKKTGERDGFRLHSKEHYEEILSSKVSQQLTVKLAGAPIATALFMGCGNTFTYVYGASDYEHRALMAPYLIQWKAVLMAKEQGYRWYDFFGIAPVEIVRGEYIYNEKHQYAGVTRFKLGFGGQVKEAPGTYDLLISPVRYRMYELLRSIRRKF